MNVFMVKYPVLLCSIINYPGGVEFIIHYPIWKCFMTSQSVGVSLCFCLVDENHHKASKWNNCPNCGCRLQVNIVHLLNIWLSSNIYLARCVCTGI